MSQIPQPQERLICSIGDTATLPSIQFGGSQNNGSGTGLRGTNETMSLSISGTDVARITSDGIIGPSAAYSGTSSHQVIAPDLELAAGAGKNVATGTAFLAPIMGNLLGASLTKTGNYLAGLIGANSVTGTQASTYPTAAVMGIVMDGVTALDGAFVAVIDGDSSQTNAAAAFTVKSNNSTANSGFQYGLDLKSGTHDGFNAVAISKADIRTASGAVLMTNAGAPSSGTTGANFADKGSLLIDVTNGKLYINTNTLASPTWTVVGTQS